MKTVLACAALLSILQTSREERYLNRLLAAHDREGSLPDVELVGEVLDAFGKDKDAASNKYKGHLLLIVGNVLKADKTTVQLGDGTGRHLHAEFGKDEVAGLAKLKAGDVALLAGDRRGLRAGTLTLTDCQLITDDLHARVLALVKKRLAAKRK